MRKVFLGDLPRKGKLIDWINSVGCRVRFEYDSLMGELEIVDYDKTKHQCEVLYNGEKTNIRTGNLKKGRIAFVIGKRSNEHEYKIGDTIQTITGRIKIIDCVRVDKNKHRGYKYKCLKDGYIGEIRESHLKKGVGCPVCCNRVTMKGVNDLATTNPEMIKYFINKNDAYNHTYSSNKRVTLKCPECGYEKRTTVTNLFQRGFSCVCGDNISYPEKFLTSLLKQLNMDFQTQLSKKHLVWCDVYKYDFYISGIKCIVETHGKQHYKETTGQWESLESIEENDYLKEQKAKKNNIKNYIILDCRESELEWIKNSVMSSNLPKLLNFDECDIDWLKCHEYACNNLVKEVCKFWNGGINDIAEISDRLNISMTTVYKYLKQGSELKWCDYEVKKGTKVICLTTSEVFESIAEAERNYKVHSIGGNCQGIKKSAGKHPETGEKLKWMYYDDYIKQQNKENIS